MLLILFQFLRYSFRKHKIEIAYLHNSNLSDNQKTTL